MIKSTRKEQFGERFEESEANYSQQNDQQQQQQPVEGKPIQLIRIKPSGKIEIIEEALSIIGGYDEPIGFVCLVGKMRTGKSCLLNKLLHAPGDGFKVDPSTESCTQGIWMWSEPYYSKQLNCYVFFLDTEGTDSPGKTADNDVKIFTLALLISTYFIYNSVGSINESALSELQMVTSLSKYIKTGEQTNTPVDEEQLHRFMPKFLWLLRDFMLKIQDDRGRTITPSQYLENCLNDRSSKSSENSKKIKKSIINFFPLRDCLTLVQPVDDQYELQRLNQLPEHSLRREFMASVNELRNKIMTNAGPKMYQGKPITGSNFSIMIDSYVNSFNSGKVPNIKTAWQQIAEDEGADAFNRALQKFQMILNDELGDNEPKGEEIYNIIFRMKEETMKQYEDHTANNKNQEYSIKLREFLKSKQAEILEENSKLNQSRNIEILYKHAQKLKTRIESNYYMSNKANRDQLEADIHEVTAKYNQQAKGGNKGQLMSEFLTTLTPMITSMKADNTEADERMRQTEIAMNEQKMRIRQLELEKQSKERQLKSQENVSKIKKDNGSKVSRRGDKADRDQGCCSGGKCQIM